MAHWLCLSGRDQLGLTPLAAALENNAPEVVVLELSEDRKHYLDPARVYGARCDDGRCDGAVQGRRVQLQPKRGAHDAEQRQQAEHGVRVSASPGARSP